MVCCGGLCVGCLLLPGVVVTAWGVCSGRAAHQSKLIGGCPRASAQCWYMGGSMRVVELWFITCS
jgi:hypothetical protein